jgi:hypothetical protein
MDGQQTNDALALFAAAVDALIATQLGSLTAVEVTGLLTGIEAQRRRLEAVDQKVIAEIGERGIAGEYTRTSPADLLVNLLRVSPREARARVGRSIDLGPRRAVTGEPLPPIFPTVADAVSAGEISASHTDVIASALDRISLVAKPEVLPVAERLLVEAARHEHPRQLAKTAQLLLARLDPDGLEPSEDELERRGGFSLAKNSDGSAVPKGLWTAELTAAWEAIFDSLAAPNPSDELPDPRSAAQRRHDALADAAHRLLRSNTLPAAGGTPVTILARTTLAELTDGSGIATTGHGQQISLSKLLQMAGDAQLIQIVCDEFDGVLGYGRERRLASVGQRHALAARDGGCSFPRLRPARRLDRSPPHQSLDRRRRNQPRQPLPPVPVPPPTLPTSRLGRPDDQRRPRMATTRLARPAPKTHPQHRTPPHRPHLRRRRLISRPRNAAGGRHV